MIKIFQGEALPIYIEVRDENGPVNLDDANARIFIYNAESGLDLDLVIVSAGMLRVDLSAEDTTELPSGVYQAEVRIWFSSGLIRTAAESQIMIVRSGFNVV